MSGLLDFLQSASNAVAGNIAGPVDLLGMGLNKLGVPVGSAPVGGTEWMKKRGLIRDVEQGPARVLGETAGLLGPTMLTRFAPQIAGGLLKGAENLAAPRTLNPQTGAVYVGGPRQQALDTAQRNAAKPVSEGGLGLPPNNTPMDRAKAMGFDTELFHGADKEMSTLKSRGSRGYLGSLYTSDTPKTPNEYAMLGAQIDDLLPSHLKGDKSYLKDFYDDDLMEYAIETQKKAPDRSPNVVPLLARSKGSMDATESFGDHAKYFKTAYPKEIRQSWEDSYPVLGNDAAILQNADPHLIGMQVTGEVGDYTASKGVPMLKFLPDPETGTNTFVIQNPSNVRSRFAAFDPARINENDLLGRANPGLLGAIGVGTLGGLGAYNYLADKKK